MQTMRKIWIISRILTLNDRSGLNTCNSSYPVKLSNFLSLIAWASRSTVDSLTVHFKEQKQTWIVHGSLRFFKDIIHGCLQNKDLRPKTLKRRPQNDKTKTPFISLQLTTNKAFTRGSSFCSLTRLNLQNEDPIHFASVGVWGKALTRLDWLWFDRPVKKTSLRFGVLGLRS